MYDEYLLGFIESGAVDSDCSDSYYLRVATAQGKQGKQGIWFLLFPDRENTGNFVLTQGKIC